MNKDTIAYQYIKENIIFNIFKPNEILDEKMIAQHLNLSTTPVKNAFRQLEKEHFIAIRPRKKTYVCPISLKMVKDLFQIRMKLEYMIIHLTLESIDQKMLHTELEKFKKEFIHARNNPGFNKAYNGFRKFFATHCGNVFLTDQMLIVYDHIFRLRKTLFKVTPRRAHAIEEQIDIIDHILKYNHTQELKDKVNRHIKNAQAAFFNHVDDMKI